MLISLTTKSLALLVAIILSLKLSKPASFSMVGGRGLRVREEEMVMARALGIWPIEAIDESRLLNAPCGGCSGGVEATLPCVDCVVSLVPFDPSAQIVFITSIAAF